MCRCPEMESYEEFCLRSLATLQEKGEFKRMTCEPLCSLEALSVIRLCGRAVLSPLLSPEQRLEMCGHRERAVQREADRQKQLKNKLLARVQNILDQAQTQKAPSEEVDTPPTSKPATVGGGYTLVPDSTGPQRESGFGLAKDDQPPPTSLTEHNGGEEVKAVNEDKSEEEEEEEDEEEDMSLDSLLKKSREYVKKEQGTQVVHSVAQSPEAANESKSPSGNSGVEFGFSLHHSPQSTPQTQIQGLYESTRLSPSLPDPCAHLPESAVSPCTRRRRPRPVSTGNIHFSFPVGPSDLIPRSPGRSGEGADVADWGESLARAAKMSDQWFSVGKDASSWAGNCRYGTAPAYEACSPIDASVASPLGHCDHPAAGFRRRCHTLDSQLHPHPAGAEPIDRSQERVPRFMAGVTWSAQSRRTPAGPLNQSYEVENPSPSLLRPHMSPESARVTLGLEPNNSQGGRSRNGPEAQAQCKTEETQRRAQVLEDMQRRMEEEHALQMSLLLAEQEKEQQRLRLELEETERRLKEQGLMRPQSGDGYAWTRRSVSDSCPAMSPSCPGLSPAHTPSERSPGQSLGFPSPVSSTGCTPSGQSPVYLWGPTWAGSKPRARLSLVGTLSGQVCVRVQEPVDPSLFSILTAQQQMAFCRIGAITRGFLTRRLLRTEKVKHMRQTVMDTQEFIRSFQTEAPQQRRSISAQDLSLQERVRAQLRAALYDIHDIFFEMTLPDRLALLQQDRELRTERKLRDMEKTKGPKERVVLSAATQRSLDRKKRVGESPAQARKLQQKPKSPTANRVLKPSQCQNSAAPGQLNRQGSWHRKTPEERVKRSDSLKKQHSLG